MGLSSVGPVGDLVAVDPDADVGAVGDDRFVEPFFVARHNPAGIDAAIDAASAAVEGLCAVAVLEAVMDLAFVAVVDFAGDGAEEDAAIEVLGVTDTFQLEREVAELGITFQRPLAVFHIQRAILGDGEFAKRAGRLLPAGQVFTIENAGQAERLKLDVFELALAAVELQADVAAWRGFGVVVGEDFFAVELDDDLGAVDPRFESPPGIGFSSLCILFAADEAAGGKRIVQRSNGSSPT